MKKRILMMVIFAGLFAPAGLMAQTAYKSGAKFILDFTPATGMPAGAVTSTPKVWTGTPSNNVPLANNDAVGSINATVFQKLEVAPTDMDAAGVIGGAGATMDWVTAFNGCKSATYDGGGWRLPTQRELQLIWIFKTALESKLSITQSFSATSYWSASDAALTSWYVSFSSGSTGNNSNKGNLNRVRCVREVP